MPLPKGRETFIALRATRKAIEVTRAMAYPDLSVGPPLATLNPLARPYDAVLMYYRKCEQCNHAVDVWSHQLSQTITCPWCHHEISIPTAEGLEQEVEAEIERVEQLARESRRQAAKLRTKRLSILIALTVLVIVVLVLLDRFTVFL